MHLTSFLPTESIRNLVLNKYLQGLCEPILYRDIDLFAKPQRSLQLLHTFALRPDLALLVRSLVIDLRWLVPEEWGPIEIPDILQADGLEALALAKNLRSFGTSAAPCISNPNLSSLRNIVSRMNLTKLSIHEKTEVPEDRTRYQTQRDGRFQFKGGPTRPTASGRARTVLNYDRKDR